MLALHALIPEPSQQDTHSQVRSLLLHHASTAEVRRAQVHVGKWARQVAYTPLNTGAPSLRLR